MPSLLRDLVSAGRLSWKMAVSNGASEPDERTALLNGDTSKPPDDAINPAGYGTADGDASKSGADDGGDVDDGGDGGGDVGDGGDADEEAGEVTEENPLFEGNEEMRKKLYILCPAVAIGVSSLIPTHSFRGISDRVSANDEQVLLIAADQTIVVSSYGRIGTDLDALNNTSWIATAFVS